MHIVSVGVFCVVNKRKRSGGERNSSSNYKDIIQFIEAVIVVVVIDYNRHRNINSL